MKYAKLFFWFLIFWIGAAFYWAYFISNLYNLKIDVKIWTWEILKEQQLFAKYNINEENSWTWENVDEKKSWKYEFFKKKTPELKIERTNIDTDKNFKPSNKIIISFSEEINLYDLLWFKKVQNWFYQCDWKKIKSEKKAERCNSENKLFIINKIDWKTDSELNNEKIFKWVVRKSKIDKRTILISTKFKDLSDYELKILKWLKSEKTSKISEWVFYELKNNFKVDFVTTDKEWNLRPKKVLNKTWSWVISWTWVINWTWKVLNWSTWTWETK